MSDIKKYITTDTSSNCEVLINKLNDEFQDTIEELNKKREERIDNAEDSVYDVEFNTLLNKSSEELFYSYFNARWNTYLKSISRGINSDIPLEKNDFIFVHSDDYELKNEKLWVDTVLGSFSLFYNEKEFINSSEPLVLKIDNGVKILQNIKKPAVDVLSVYNNDKRDINVDLYYNDVKREYIKNGISEDLIKLHFEKIFPKSLNHFDNINLINLVMGQKEKVVVTARDPEKNLIEQFCDVYGFNYYSKSIKEDHNRIFISSTEYDFNDINKTFPLDILNYLDFEGNNVDTYREMANYMKLPINYYENEFKAYLVRNKNWSAEDVKLIDKYIEYPLNIEEKTFNKALSRAKNLKETVKKLDKEKRVNVGEKLIKHINTMVKKQEKEISEISNGLDITTKIFKK